MVDVGCAVVAEIERSHHLPSDYVPWDSGPWDFEDTAFDWGSVQDFV